MLSRSVCRLALPLALLAASTASVMSRQVESPEVGVPFLYTGLIVWAFFWAFLDAYTIGANDVANSFANAVGAGTLTHKGACAIASVCELIGVLALGSNVTDTIRSKMIAVDLFYNDPYVLSLGMSMVNVGSGLWVLAATMLSMPVSTTHSVVGAVCGIGIAAFGPGGVNWAFDKKGFTQVIASWFISPVLAGTLSAIIYMSCKVLVLQFPTEKALHRGLLLMPAYLFLTFGIIWGFMFMKGIPAMKKTPYEVSVPLTVGLAVFHAILGAILVSPWLRRTIIDREKLPWYSMAYVPCVAVGQYGYEEVKEGKTLQSTNAQPMPLMQAPMQQMQMPYGQMGMQPMQMAYSNGMPGAPPAMQPNGMPMGYYYGNMQMGSAFGLDDFGKTVAPGLYQDVGARREEDAEMHAVAFQSEDQVEELFKFAQLTSCCFFSIAHGANDVANAVGPFATVWMVYSTGNVSSKAEVPFWVLVYGAVALDIGLITMGHYIMAALGNRVTLQTPSRGFCITLGAMFTAMLASRLGIPVSTTHCISGSTIAVGLCNGSTKAINLKLVAIIFLGWIITCPAAGLVTGFLFLGIASAPRPMPQNGFFTGSLPGEL